MPDPDQAEDAAVTPPARTRTLLAWASWLVSFGCCAAGLVVTLLVVRPVSAGVLAQGATYALAFPLGYATVGLFLALRRPANPIGWLFAASGLIWSLNIPFDPWVRELLLAGRPLPLAAQLAAAFGEYAWAPAISLGITLPALVVPDGHLRSRRWRVVAATAVAGPVAAVVGGALASSTLQETVVPIPNPLGLAGVAGAVAEAVSGIGLLLWIGSVLAALVSLVLRFRSSRGTERQQLRWVAAGATATVVGLLVGIAGWTATYRAVVLLPVGVGVAVLRYRLWDLDRLVSRTITYALVTAVLVVPYLLILPAATRLAGGSGNLAVAAVTLAAAAAFAPVRHRVQAVVDRRFNRPRHDAARIIEGFGARLRDQVDLDTLQGELLAVVDQTMQPTRASLWLRAPAGQEPVGG